MEDLIIGTAGHVDHGKTALVKALTGVDTDRLEEEKKRGITIELGFAQLQLTQGLQASIIDVPGHERFIKNMLAGAGGIDMALLVVAADEGVMPQTREHIAILALLGIEKGLIVLSKCDLVEEDWLTLVQEEIQQEVKETFLEHMPCLCVSAKTGMGLTALQQAIAQMAIEKKERAKGTSARLPIDRVFSLMGFGTVITGTLLTGDLKVGDVVELLPSRKKSRIRTLQVHGQKVTAIEAGHRVAVNLADLEVDQIARGEVLVAPDTWQATRFLDVKLQLLKTALHPLKNRARIRFHLGTSEVMGRVILLNQDMLEPGESGFAQIRLEAELLALAKDRFVLRSYSPVETIGGGFVLEAHPKQHKRFRERIIGQLQQKEEGSFSELLEQELLENVLAFKKLDEFHVGSVSACQEAMLSLLEEGKAIRFADWYVHKEGILAREKQLRELLLAFHEDSPWKKGYSKELARKKLTGTMPLKLFQSLVQYFVEAGWLDAKEDVLCLTTHKPEFNQQEKRAQEKIAAIYEAAGFTPPAKAEIWPNFTQLEQSVYQALLDLGILIAIGTDIIFLASTLELGKKILQNAGTAAFTVAEFRNLVQSSRKYAVPLLEYYDRLGITKRNGDKRMVIARN